MKLRLLLFCAVFLGSQLAWAQRFPWFTSGGYVGVTNSYDGCKDLARANDGSLYTMDFVLGQQQVQGDTIDLMDNQYNTFMHKFSDQGVHQWSMAIGGYFNGLAVATDNNNDVYLLGQTGGSTIIMEDTVLLVTASRNYLLKFDPNGDLIWAFNSGFGSNNKSTLLLCDGEHIFFQTEDTRISRITTDGVLLSTIEATWNIYNEGFMHWKKGEMLSNGDVVFTGLAYGSLAFGEDSLYLTPTPGSLCVLLRTNEDLEPIWAKRVGQVTTPSNNFIPLTVDAADNIYMGLQIPDSLFVGSDTLTNEFGNFVGGLIMYNGLGEGIWGKEFLSEGNTAVTSLTYDELSGRVWAAGYYRYDPEFSNGALEYAGMRNEFICSVQPDGTLADFFDFIDGQAGADPNIILSDDQSHFYVGGIIGDGTAQVSCIDYPTYDGFYIGHFVLEPNVVPQPTIAQGDGALVASPVFSGTIQWLLNDEPITGANGQTYTPLVDGSYSVVYTYEDGCVGSDSSAVLFATRIEELEGGAIQLWPNPANDVVYLSSPALIRAYTIYTADGRLVYTNRNLASYTVPVETILWPQGAYVVHIVTDAGQTTKGLVRLP